MNEPAKNETDLPFVLGIVGDSGSGKSTIANGVRMLIGPDRVADLKLDDYHRFTREERVAKGLTALNPMVHNLSLMQEHLQLLRRGRPIRNRSYEHSDGTFGPIRRIEPRNVVLARGLLGFPTEELRAAYDLAVFLHPDPDLLFRWKLRRDVRSRGYTETEVLSHIAHHLLDSKQFVDPQAERADLVVRYELPEEEGADATVRTSILLRREAAELVRDPQALARFGEGIRKEMRGEEVVIHLTRELTEEEVEAWARERFPERCDPARLGTFEREEGGVGRRVELAFIQVMIARFTERLRRSAGRG